MFGRYVTGNVVSSCGNWVQQIAAAVLMFQLTRSAFMVGAVSMALFAGPLLLALWTGVLSDRRDRRRVLMVGRGLTCLAVGVLAFLDHSARRRRFRRSTRLARLRRRRSPPARPWGSSSTAPASWWRRGCSARGFSDAYPTSWWEGHGAVGVAFLGSRPLAAPVNGAVADATSVTVAMLVAAVVVFAASLLARVGHSDVSRSL